MRDDAVIVLDPVNRTSLFQTDYEQYKISPPYLIAECGSVRNGKHLVAEQRKIVLEPALSEKLYRPLWELLAMLGAEEHPFAEPGSNAGIADPGQFFLHVEIESGRRSIRTSLDSISAPRTSYELLVLQFTQALRGVPDPPLCGMKQFYGISR